MLNYIFGYFLQARFVPEDLKTKSINSDSIDSIDVALHSTNALIRKEAIISIKKNKLVEFIMPLFELLMNPSSTTTETEMITDILYSITDGKIVSYIVQLLTSSTLNNNNTGKPLTDKQIIKLLDIVAKVSKEQMEKEKFNISFLEKTLNSSNNDVVLASLNCIAVTGYTKLYQQVQKLYSQNLFLKIPVIKTLTLLSLNDEKYEEPTKQFILKKIAEETHPNVQEENYLALYMLIQHLLDIPGETTKLVKHIVGLNNISLNSSLQEEKYLLSHPFKTEQISLVQFFLSDFIPTIVKSKLTHILYAENNFSFLDTAWLLKNIQNRYMDNNSEDAYKQLAAISTIIYINKVDSEDSLKNIMPYIRDKGLTYSFVQGFNDIFLKKKSILEEFVSYIKNLATDNAELINWVAIILYQIQGIESLEKWIDSKTEEQKMGIFHTISGCKIPLDERQALIQKYNSNTFQSENSQDIFDQMLKGVGVCYFG